MPFHRWRQRPARGALGLGERRGEVRGARHHLSGRAHLRPEHGVGAREAGEREDGRLDARHGRSASPVPSSRSADGPRGEPARGVDEVQPDRLARERHRARGARVRLEDVEASPTIASWTFTSPTTPSAGASVRTVASTRSSVCRRERRRREDAGGVARVDAGLLDVLHHCGDEVSCRPSQSASTSISTAPSRKRSTRTRAGLRGRGGDFLRAVADAHVAAAEDVRRADEHRIADLAPRSRSRPPGRAAAPHGRDVDAELARRERRSARGPRRGRLRSKGVPRIA